MLPPNTAQSFVKLPLRRRRLWGIQEDSNLSLHFAVNRMTTLHHHQTNLRFNVVFLRLTNCFSTFGLTLPETNIAHEHPRRPRGRARAPCLLFVSAGRHIQVSDACCGPQVHHMNKCSFTSVSEIVTKKIV